MLPQSKSPSLRIHPTRIAITAQHLNDQNFQTYGLAVGGYSANAALPIPQSLTFKQKIGTFSA